MLEALERPRRLGDVQLPVALVVDEAHSLIRQRFVQATDDQAIPATRLCREAFERIAREGRKFGLSLVVSSQRPSELSETVLSQCNAFIVHRIVNGRDQDQVRRLLPDSLRGLTDELPSRDQRIKPPTIVGWATDVPTLVRIDDLAESYRPRSADQAFVAAWQGGQQGGADWSKVVEAWTGEGKTSRAVPAAVAPAAVAAPAAAPTAQDHGDEIPF